MPLYNQQETKIISYQRAKQIIIKNELDSPPIITFVEEIIQDGVAVGSPKTRPINKKFTPELSSEVVDLLSPVTGEIIGQTTYGDIYNSLYSLYFKLAAERDQV